MKKIFLKCLFLLSVLAIVESTFAQDLITLKSGDEVKSKVLEVTPDMIKYKNWSNPEGPTYSVSKGEVFMIKYANGTKDVFKIAPESTISKSQAVEKNTIATKGDKKVIDGEDDWEKVILTQTANEIEGLTKKGELKVSSANLGMITPERKTEEKLRTKIKKEAAKLGAHIVLITPMAVSANYSLSGIAYGYK
jgi:hypothetical protein